jgi:hypothetical protein
MKVFIPGLLILLLFIPSACTPQEKEKKEKLAYEYFPDGKIMTESQTKNGKAHGLLKNYTRGGTLESVYTYNMGLREGPAVMYYPNGQLKAKMMYRDNKREGEARMYYRSGELFRIIPYRDGKIHGIRKSFYKSGQLSSEAPYSRGYPGLGLKEYDRDGNLIKDYPQIRIREINQLAMANRYILRLSLSPSQPGTQFYVGDLEEGKYLHLGLWPVSDKNGTFDYSLTISRGGFLMQTETITAVYETSLSNKAVVSRKINLALDNK